MTTDPALIERMEKLILHAAVSASGYTQGEAKAIVALLPNRDQAAARRIIAMYHDSDYPSFGLEAAIVEAIKHGRANPA